MRREEFESICQSVQAGTEQRVRHIVTHQTGRIIACELGQDLIEVEVEGGEHKAWAKDNVKLLQ